MFVLKCSFYRAVCRGKLTNSQKATLAKYFLIKTIQNFQNFFRTNIFLKPFNYLSWSFFTKAVSRKPANLYTLYMIFRYLVRDIGKFYKYFTHFLKKRKNFSVTSSSINFHCPFSIWKSFFIVYFDVLESYQSI